MTMGPVQLLVVGFGDPAFTGEIQAELDRLRADDVVRVLDLARRPQGRRWQPLRETYAGGGLPGAGGAIAGALAGLEQGRGCRRRDGRPGRPASRGRQRRGRLVHRRRHPEPDSAAAVVVLEHRWAIPLRNGIRRAGGFHLADAWIHPADLVGIGLVAAEEADRQLSAT